ncbi:MAG: TetR/AcrR family transcriptional regulator [Armatimonadetes bacterium]|nr:TetR/AcrR family transcriptional regulator [Armatimonadota bacterium]
MSPPPIDTRERLVESARDLFLVQGYNATGIAQILKSAQVHSGSLYHYFPTKEDLLVAVLEWYRDNIYEGLLKPVYERIDDPIERIFGVLDGYRQLVTMLEFQYGCPIGNLALELSNSHPHARSLMRENFENWLAAVEENLAAASDRLPEGTDLRALALFTLTVMEGAVMLAKTYRTIEPFDTAVAQLRDHYDRLLASGLEWSAPRSVGSATVRDGIENT